MSDIRITNQPQGLMDAFLQKMTEGSGTLNQLLAFMSLSTNMAALNLISSLEQKTSSGSSLDDLLGGADTQGLQSIIGNMLGQGGNKPNLTDILGMVGSSGGQQGQGKINPQMLLSLLSMFSQMDTKKKPASIEEKDTEGEKVKELGKEKQQDKK